MNLLHRRYCGSDRWARRVSDALLPWALHDVELGDDLLEIGPGLGVTTAELADRVARLTAVEVDAGLAAGLRRRFAASPAVEVRTGDGADLPLPADRFTAVVCFTMLHHLPSADRQDRLFAEAFRVLRPGGTFAGSDSLVSVRFRLYHVFDTMVPVDPDALPERLAAAGFGDVRVDTAGGTAFRFRARKP